MHYSFKRDLADGKRGETIVRTYLESRGLNVEELPKKSPEGDLKAQSTSANSPTSYEVKYDIMSKRTGNMCFEVANGKGDLTGIAATKADIVVYVVPLEKGHALYLFSREVLYNWLFKEGIEHRIVNGGDKKRFSMILVPLDTIDKLTWCEKVVLNA